MTGNLYQIVRAVHAGQLAVTAEQQKDLEEALVNVRDMRQLLMTALGLHADTKNVMKDGGTLRVPPETALPPAAEDGGSGSSGGKKS